MDRITNRLISNLLGFALLLTACEPVVPQVPATVITTEVTPASPVEEPTEITPPFATATALPQPALKSRLLVCQVTDTGGIDDKSFNAATWKGIEMAETQLGVDGKYLESKIDADYDKNLNELIREKCDFIISTGFLLSNATRSVAFVNPNQKFSIVDYSYDPVIPNILSQVFTTHEAAFLAGYLAAGMTKTGKIGTFGGFPIPTVTIFMDGLAQGVAYYNHGHATNVEIVGWNIDNPQSGHFINDFSDQQKGAEAMLTLLNAGCDIIMPVAGEAGLGAARIAKAQQNAMIIGVDSDWYNTAPEYGSVMLTSVMKNMDVTTYNAIKLVVGGSFKGGTIVGSLANGGVGLAPFHDYDDKISPALKNELEQVKQDIITGKIQVHY